MIRDILDSVYESLVDEHAGEVANYIPQLGEADPSHFGIALATMDGKVFSVGDTSVPFTIQSMSKPFTFALALTELGVDKVYEHTSVEPSGDDFNSVVLNENSLPFNPMVNSGAISMTGLLCSVYGDDTFAYIHEAYNKLAGEELGIDRGVFKSELANADRNRAIAHLMHGAGVIGDVDQVVETYTRQCSILVTTEQLAAMATTVANMGINPKTHETVLDPLAVRNTLSVMFTCGMYNYSGHWAVEVGLPAKSGVSGGVFAVVNRQLGVATYSPKLDARGNSVRGIQVCTQLAEELGLNAFELANMGSSLLDIYLRDD